MRRIDAGGLAGGALGIVSHMLESLSVNARASIRTTGTGPDDPAVIDIQGEDAGLLIGKRGDTLRSLQFLLNTMLAQRSEGDDPVTPVMVDVEHYRRRREQNLQRLAESMARRATTSGRTVELEPMSPADRRTVHMALADSTAVTTESAGDGPDRRVTIRPIGAGRSDEGRRGPARDR